MLTNVIVIERKSVPCCVCVCVCSYLAQRVTVMVVEVEEVLTVKEAVVAGDMGQSPSIFLSSDL